MIKKLSLLVAVLLLGVHQAGAYLSGGAFGWPSPTNYCLSILPYTGCVPTNSVIHGETRAGWGGGTQPSSIWWNIGGVSTPVQMTNDFTGAACGDIVAINYTRSWNRGANNPQAVVTWSYGGYYVLSGTTNRQYFAEFAAGGSPGGLYHEFSFRLCGFGNDGGPSIALLRLTPDPSITRVVNPITVLVPDNPPNAHPHYPWGTADQDFNPKMRVDGNYGDSYQVQEYQEWGGPCVWSTNFVSSTNNISVTNYTEATLSFPFQAWLITNENSVFWTTSANGQQGQAAYGIYSVTVPANSAFPVAYQFAEPSFDQTVSNLFTMSIGNGALFGLSNGVTTEVDLDSSTNWSPADAVFDTGSGGLLWNSNASPMSVTFQGIVPAGAWTNSVPAGYSYQSWPLPQAYTIDSIGFPAADNDQVFKWSTTSNAWVTFTYNHTNTGTIGPGGQQITNYWAPYVPSFGRGEAFLSWKGAATNWVFHLPDPARYTVAAEWASGANVTKAQVNCIHGIPHSWTNGQLSVSMCVGDSVYFETSQDPNYYSWSRNLAQVVVTDNYDSSGNATLYCDLGAYETRAQWTLLDTATNLVREPHFTYPSGMFYETQVFSTNVVLTVQSVGTNYNYTVAATPDFSNWKLGGFTPATNGIYTFNVGKAAGDTNQFYKLSWHHR